MHQTARSALIRTLNRKSVEEAMNNFIPEKKKRSTQYRTYYKKAKSSKGIGGANPQRA
jgi:hypothetical protein